jgi:hypothetical protein
MRHVRGSDVDVAAGPPPTDAGARGHQDAEGDQQAAHTMPSMRGSITIRTPKADERMPQ